jgi:methylenetetrahydrofolate dehydrogenase (NADP+) / methenyltetrahydrofolate cyclohydrolase
MMDLGIDILWIVILNLMVLVDGKKIAADISVAVAARVAVSPTPVRLVVVACDPNFETKKYLTLKQARAAALGIALEVEVLPRESDTMAVVAAIEAALPNVDGVVVQLPLPRHIDTAVVLAAVPAAYDVDAFSYQGEPGTTVLPPVVAAIDAIARRHDVSFKDKKVVVFGEGRLVGAPAAAFARSEGANVTVLTETSENVADIARGADIIILGVGKPNLLMPEMVKDGVVVFDAGASEDGGLLVGDAAPAVAEKAALFTPVPGGIGPITISVLFQNLLELKARQ